jgi:putative MATE family efflux protein
MTGVAQQKSTHAVFLEGTIMRHVVVMTLTSAFGLMAMFMVDLADLFFLSMLKQTEVTAAIGFAGTLAFANLSMSLGIGIAAAALVARNLGAGNQDVARQFAGSTLMFAMLISAVFTVFAAIFAEPTLRLLGADGEALRLAKLFLWTLTPGFILLAGAVCCSFILRALGDPRRAMYITLSAAVVTIILDPIAIFVFGWGIQGAAVANVVSDVMAFGLGLYGLVRVHKFLPPLKLSSLIRDFWPIWAIAFPAILTQLATPFSNAYITYVVAPFGNEAVAASAIIGRLIPVAFGIIFSLSGSVGPIIGQNFGAQKFERVRQTLKDGMLFSAVYTLITSALLFLFRHQIAEAFHASGRTTEIVVFFCCFIAISWAFAGAQFVANAAFNNLGRPTLSTWYNWGKATLGTIPFAMIGAHYWEAEGVLIGTAIGSIVFGVASSIAAFRVVDHLAMKPALATVT